MPAFTFTQARPGIENLHTMNDTSLVRIAQSRQDGPSSGAEAICTLYDRYQQAVFRFLWSRLPDRQSAEDLTGEVFTRMVSSLPGFRSAEVPFAAWLFRIARNLLIDHYRKEGRKVNISLEQVAPLGGDAGDPAKSIEGRMNVEKVRKALEKLQPAHQEVIVMRFILGFSLKEAAALLGKTVGAIKITQHRGLNELRSILGAEGIEE